MSPRSIREYVAAIRPRYLHASWREKGRILTEVCRTTGYHRKAAIRLLRRSSLSQPRPRSGRPRQYDVAVAQALRRVWEASDFLGSKRLVPFFPEFIPILERHGELTLAPLVRAALLRISPPTTDRLLKPFRQAVRRPYTGRPSEHALRAQIPIRTFGEWAHVGPGSVQADLVAHCGETTRGFYLYSLVAVDVATGWTECQVIWGKSYHRVVAALDFIRRRLPFPLRELHTDNGGEFVNTILLPWCRRYDIRLTRGRPYRKNDQAHAEQRVWAAVRRLIGYDRYTTHGAYDTLQRLYPLLRLHLNFFQPVAKLQSRTRVGSRVIKRYDLARTPAQRLLAWSKLPSVNRKALTEQLGSVNPVRLRHELYALLHALWKQADRPQEVTPILRQRPGK